MSSTEVGSPYDAVATTHQREERFSRAKRTTGERERAIARVSVPHERLGRGRLTILAEEDVIVLRFSRSLLVILFFIVIIITCVHLFEKKTIRTHFHGEQRRRRRRRRQKSARCETRSLLCAFLHLLPSSPLLLFFFCSLFLSQRRRRRSCLAFLVSLRIFFLSRVHAKIQNKKTKKEREKVVWGGKERVKRRRRREIENPFKNNKNTRGKKKI